MILLNFSHPLNPDQLGQIETILGQSIGRVVEIHSQIDTQQPLAEQVANMLTAVSLSPTEWQSSSLLINPPALNFSTAVLLAQLHGRMGYFPPIIRLRPVVGSLPPRFEVAQIINLQELRHHARQQRSHLDQP